MVVVVVVVVVVGSLLTYLLMYSQLSVEDG